MTNIGEKIKELRTKNKLTQQELGDKLYVSDKTISSWESGRTLPDINTLIDISNVFNISVSNFISNTNDKNIEIEFKIRVSRVGYKYIRNWKPWPSNVEGEDIVSTSMVT